MPHPVIHWEILGADPDVLHEFYREAFGWELMVFPSGYALVETDSHVHDEDTDEVTYDGEDAFMNEGVTMWEEDGTAVWRYVAEPAETVRPFARGIGGGIGYGGTGVSIGIQVPDLDATLARIEALGGSRVREPEEVVPGVWTADFHDPEGNLIGLIEFRPVTEEG